MDFVYFLFSSRLHAELMGFRLSVCVLFLFYAFCFRFCFRATGRFGARRRFFCLLIRCFINLYKRFSSSVSSVTDFATPRPENRRKELILSLVRPRVRVGGSTRTLANKKNRSAELTDFGRVGAAAECVTARVRSQSWF